MHNLYPYTCHRRQWSLQISITLTEGGLLIFLQSGVEKLLAWAAGIQPTTLDFSSQSGAFDLSAMATPLNDKETKVSTELQDFL